MNNLEHLIGTIAIASGDGVVYLYNVMKDLRGTFA